MINPGVRSGKKCILAVDDAAIILLRITDALGEYYDVVTVNSGARALRYLERKKPDLILLDGGKGPRTALRPCGRSGRWRAGPRSR